MVVGGRNAWMAEKGKKSLLFRGIGDVHENMN